MSDQFSDGARLLEEANERLTASQRLLDQHAAERLICHLSLVCELGDYHFPKHWHTVLVRAGNYRAGSARGLLSCLSAVVGSLVPKIMDPKYKDVPFNETSDELMKEVGRRPVRSRLRTAANALESGILSASIELHPVLEKALAAPATMPWPAAEHLFKLVDRLELENEDFRTACVEAGEQVEKAAVELLRLHLQHLVMLPELEAWNWINSALVAEGRAPTSFMELVDIFEKERLSEAARIAAPDGRALETVTTIDFERTAEEALPRNEAAP